MKIAIRGGHNPLCTGASALIDELTEDRKVYVEVINYLKQAGHTVIDCTPSPTSSQGQDLSNGVNKANSNGVDLFISIHFNKAYDSYDGALGSEVWSYPNDSLGNEVGIRVLKNLQSLGFKNRGIKDGKSKSLYEINKTSMTALIVEVCFVEATKDVELYKSLGYKRVALAIAEGIHGSKIGNEINNTTIEPQYYVETSYINPDSYVNGILKFFDSKEIKIQLKSDSKGAFLQTMHMKLDKCKTIAYTFTGEEDIMAYVWREDKITDQYENISYTPRVLV